ncbi:4-hydroxyphenylpyruvate dioxygenase [Streptomyces sp. H27-H1]|uniref:4-hydroxyphenylpyruvate dioxygenase n=1 Tax=Streptomyces sp. H27-H1 TaxID=2996461 RepID=UPI002270E783|nr:4-hydroxyphenylpyruvate dioxygenase [Streptomyces sp. H27-H1]MCY0931127.1 4-hydroxyphenylpyruvate dioxygenase [Streptomyces sp. H27-H1]
MTTAHEVPFDDMTVNHIELYVRDIRAKAAWLVDQYGLTVEADNEHEAAHTGARSVALGSGRISVVLTEALDEEHPAAVYVERHGDGVGNIALRVPNATAAFREAVRRGARPLAPPVERDGVVTASITAFGDVSHMFVERRAGAAKGALPGLRPVARREPAQDMGLTDVDHFAVCLEAGTLEGTVDHYRRVLGFDMIFAEDVVVGAQAMNSKVVQSRSGAVTLTLIEPDLSREPGQIDEFLKGHDGPGVQHIAWNSEDIVRSVRNMRSSGVDFLNTPDTYYTLLADRLTVRWHSIDDLRDHDILMDEDHDGQLFQIFTRSVHPRRTLFMEVIERAGARTFGSGNIKALYEAVELQRANEGAFR